MSLREFLIRAKAATYASEGEGDGRRLEDEARELTFCDGEYLYRDRYYGFNPFAGEEVVWRNGQPVWAMNYYGEVTNDTVRCIDVYRFLQKALRQVDLSRPLRGPSEFSDGAFTYRTDSTGGLDRFSGRETISFRGREVYSLDYHGGRVAYPENS